MMKISFVITGFALLQSLFCFSQNVEGIRLGESEVYKTFDKPYVSYTFERIYCSSDGCDTSRFPVYINRKVQLPVLYYVADNTLAMRYTREDLTWIDWIGEEVGYYLASAVTDTSGLYVGGGQTLYSYLSYDLCSYAFKDNYDKSIRISRIVRDTLIEGKAYDVFWGRSAPSLQVSFYIDHKDTVECYQEVEIRLNRTTDFVESTLWRTLKMDGTPTESADNYILCRYTNLSFDNRDAEHEEMFSEKNPVYAIYEHCDDLNRSRVMTALGNVFKELTDEILDYPLVNTQHDTITLREQDSWVLLGTWYDGCASCKEWIADYMKEKREKGITKLEKMGVKVICINPFALDFERMRGNEQKLDAKGMLYSARGLHKIIDLDYFPSYYLISPDKKLVYSHIGYFEKNKQLIKAVKKHVKK